MGGAPVKHVVALLLALGLLIASAPTALACYGAAAMAMGGAYTSVANGVLAVYWNQAGLAFTPGRGEVSLTQSAPLDYLNYNAFYGAAVKVNDRLGLGFGHTVLAPWAGNERWNTFAAGLKLTDDLAVGGAFRLLDGTDPDTGSYYTSQGFDLSAQYHREIASGTLLNLGLLVQDVGGPSATNLYWQNIRPAISLETDKLTLAFDVYDAAEIRYALRSEYNFLQHQVGMEYRPLGREGGLALRGGFYHDVLTFGAGLRLAESFVDFMAMPEWEAIQVTAGVRF